MFTFISEEIDSLFFRIIFNYENIGTFVVVLTDITDKQTFKNHNSYFKMVLMMVAFFCFVEVYVYMLLTVHLSVSGLN